MKNVAKSAAADRSPDPLVATTNAQLREAWGNPERMTEVQAEILSQKKLLLNWYRKIYRYLAANLSAATVNVEIGSGSSRLYEHIDGLIRSNVVFIKENDLVFSAYEMPFQDNSVGNIILISVLHHLAEPYAFFQEAERVLKPGGRVLISDPYLSILSYPVWKYLHPEGCDRKHLGFASAGSVNPITDANSANATILFCSGKNPFAEQCRSLSLVKVEFHTKFLYWLAGGYNFPQFVPSWSLPAIDFLERALAPFDKWMASFLFAVVEKEK